MEEALGRQHALGSNSPALFTLESAPEERVLAYSYAVFQKEVGRDNVKSVTVSQGSEAKGMLKSGAPLSLSLPPNAPSNLLEAHNVEVKIEASSGPTWLSAWFTFSPILLGNQLLAVGGFLLGVEFYWGVRWSRRFTTGSTAGGL